MNDRRRRRFLKDFKHKGNLTVDAITRSHKSHVVTKAVRADESEKAKHQYEWVIKEALSLPLAEEEKHAQESLRIMMPHHPKTRVVYENGQAYVLSKFIPGFVSLDEMIFENLPNYAGNEAEKETARAEEIIRRKLNINEWLKDVNDCHPLRRGSNDAAGMGEIMIHKLKPREIDLNLANIGKNAEGKFVSIDGDQTYSYAATVIEKYTRAYTAEDIILNPGKFAHEGAAERYIKEEVKKNLEVKMTSAVIDGLPWVNDYFANNWLDIKGNFQSNEYAILMGGGKMTEFRLGVNRGLLKMLLFPDDLAVRQTKFDISVEPDAERMIAHDKEQKEIFEIAALNSKSFREFLLTPEAQKIKAEFLQNLLQHKIESKIHLVVDPVKTTKDLDEKFKELKQAAPAREFLTDLEFILLNYANPLMGKNPSNQSFIDDYNKIVHNPASDRAKMQLLFYTAKEAIDKMPVLPWSETLFKKKTPIQELHHIISLYEKNPTAAISKIHKLKDELMAAPSASMSASSSSENSTTPPRPRSPGGQK